MFKVGVVGARQFVESRLHAGVDVEALLDARLFVNIAQVEVAVLQDLLDNLVVQEREAELSRDEGREVGVLRHRVEIYCK